MDWKLCRRSKLKINMNLDQQILEHLKSNPPEHKRDMCGLVAMTKQSPDGLRGVTMKLCGGATKGQDHE